jgi:hypothetical protein
MPKIIALPSRETVLEHLRYEPETGEFWWVRRAPRRSLWKPAGGKHYRYSDGKPAHISIKLNDQAYQAHRLAWLVMTGADPGSLTVDHLDRDPFNNRFSNLRLADSALQSLNRHAYGVSKYKGVAYNRRDRKWQASYAANGRRYSLGYFATEEEAGAAAAPYYTP